MKKNWLFVGVTLIVAFLLIIFRGQALAAVNKVFYYSPCEEPIRYRIGEIDPNFKVTPDELLVDIQAAANIWNSTQGKQLFKYDPKSDFTINLIYDDRQKLTSEITEMNKNLQEQQDAIDPKLDAFKKKQDEFEKKIFALNERIKYWNERGGAPQEEYEKLVAEQKQLQTEAQELNRVAEELGQSTSDYNASAQKLNSTIDDFKEVLVTKPEEGLYEVVKGKKRINIYIDVHESEFLHTLAHELGHALGLEHNNAPNSIMHPQTTVSLTPTQTEIEELTNICKKRTIFEILTTKMEVLLMILGQRLTTAPEAN